MDEARVLFELARRVESRPGESRELAILDKNGEILYAAPAAAQCSERRTGLICSVRWAEESFQTRGGCVISPRPCRLAIRRGSRECAFRSAASREPSTSFAPASPIRAVEPALTLSVQTLPGEQVGRPAAPTRLAANPFLRTCSPP